MHNLKNLIRCAQGDQACVLPIVTGMHRNREEAGLRNSTHNSKDRTWRQNHKDVPYLVKERDHTNLRWHLHPREAFSPDLALENRALRLLQAVARQHKRG
jgi:hypothetical protein